MLWRKPNPPTKEEVERDAREDEIEKKIKENRRRMKESFSRIDLILEEFKHGQH